MELDEMFGRFASNREELRNSLMIAGEVLDDIGAKTESDKLKKDVANLVTDTFKVLVIGEFKRGKSTFINALLGEEVLPAYSTPCTAIINEIKYSDVKKAVLYFNERVASAKELTPEVKRHVEAHKGGPVPPMEIPVDQIEEYVVIPDPGKDQEASVAESPFDRVELYWPIDLCKNRVEIIDSPGLNEHGTRTKVTTGYLDQVDAIIFVLSCSMLASESELHVINDSIRAGGHDEIFFVCNRFDEIRERERERIVSYGKKRLADKTALGESGIHFLSARDALDGKLDNDGSLLEKSGFPPLEKDLAGFLVKNRGRIKLMRPLTSARRQMQDVVRKTIPMQINLLKQDVEKVQKLYEAEQPKLNDAEKRRLMVLEKLSVASESLRESVRRKIRSYIVNAANEVPDIVSGCETKRKITFLSTESTKRQCEELCKELLTVVEIECSSRQKNWVNNELVPEIEERVKAMVENVRVDINSFLETLDSVRGNFSEGVVEDDRREVSGMERILAAGVGLFVLSPGSMILAGQDGFGGLFKSVLPQLGVAFAMGMLGFLNPVIFIPALIATGGLQAYFNNTKLEAKVKDEFAQRVRREMIEHADEGADAAMTKLGEVLSGMRDQVDGGMLAEIQSIRESVATVLKRKTDTSSDVARKIDALEQLKVKADGVVDALDALAEDLS